VCAGSLDSPKRFPIQPADTGSIFVRGYLVFGRQGSLIAQPFDAERLSATGAEIVIAERVVTRAAIGSAAQLMEFSVAGRTLAFRTPGSDATVIVRNWLPERS
jgi:hypothetical protein